MISAEYVDHMGSDLSVVNAARVSFAKESEWGTESVTAPDGTPVNIYMEGVLSDKDTRLIQFLARERHELPFAHTAITLRCSAPIPQRTHAFKSKVGFVENEESRRYISDRPELFVPEFREAVKDKKQGSGGPHEYSVYWKARYVAQCTYAIKAYRDMIAAGVCPEQARYILPQGVMVNWIWTGSLLAYVRFYKLRSKPDTQKETRDLAELVGQHMALLYPVSWDALVN